MLKHLKFYSVLAALVTLSSPALADDFKFDLAQDHVNITTGFTGADLQIFGTKSRNGDVVIVLEGPVRRTIVRRKENVLGTWVNMAWLSFKDVPSYYDIATTVSNIEDLMPPSRRAEYRIGIDTLHSRPEPDDYDGETVKVFQQALIRNKQAQGLYPAAPQDLKFIDENFFRADFHVPANVPTGKYMVHGYLIRNGKIVDTQSKIMTIEQIGLSAEILDFAHNHAFSYSLIVVFLGFFAGWLSNALTWRR